MLGDAGRWLAVPLLLLAIGQGARRIDIASTTTLAAPVAIYQDVDRGNPRLLTGFVAELDTDAGSAVLGRWDLPDSRWVRCEREAPGRYHCDTPSVPRGTLTALVQPLPGR